MRGDVLRGGVGKRVRVGVDEAGDDGVRGEIGEGNPGGCRVDDGLNAIAGDEDVGVRMHGAGADINEFAGENRLRDGGLLRMSCENGEEEGGNETAT